MKQRTKAILKTVLQRGDEAVLEFTAKFDGAKLTAEQLVVTQAELFQASLAADEPLRAAVAEAENNIAAFAKKSLRKNWQSKNSHGAAVGEKFDPFQRVGVYIPGGAAPLVSTALMTITLAKVAGCKEIVVDHALRQGRLRQCGDSLCRAGGGRHGDLPRRRRAGGGGDGLRHPDHPPRAENFRPRQRLCQHGQAPAGRARGD